MFMRACCNTDRFAAHPVESVRTVQAHCHVTPGDPSSIDVRRSSNIPRRQLMASIPVVVSMVNCQVHILQTPWQCSAAMLCEPQHVLCRLLALGS